MTEDYEKLAKKLFEFFVANDRHYAIQLKNGLYQTRYKPLRPVNIEKMLQNKESYLIYQESNGYLKWVCLDLDIDRNLFNKSTNKAPYLNELKESASRVTNLLKSYSIDFLLECSGNRGIHIWIIFDKYITKAEGFGIVDKIATESKCEMKRIHIDKYPKTYKINKKSKGLGLGVKLPLSLHQRSQKLSYLLDDISEFTSERDKWPNSLYDDLISGHLKLLHEYKEQNNEEIIERLGINLTEYSDTSEGKYIKADKVKINRKEALDSILQSLRRCKKLEPILKEYQKGLRHKQREIMVGLLGRLQVEGNEEYGKDLLKEFFSRMTNYREELTNKKLEMLWYYPLSCKYLGDDKCGTECKGINSPIELIKGIKIEKSEQNGYFRFSQKNFDRIVKAQKKYSYINDEVPLYTIERELENLNYSDVIAAYNMVLENKRELGHYYSFVRKEGETDYRELSTLNAIDKVLTTFMISILNSIFHTEISNNSYGYQIAHSFNNNYIFYAWLRQWEMFKNQINDIISDSIYDDYFLLKLDLKGFYDNICLDELRIKLYDQPLEGVKKKVEDFNENEKRNYSNIIDYLIHICSKIGSENRGVPQGPAFARFLAEIYLIDLDNFIEGSLNPGFELYYRYVDDIFIFFQNEEKAKDFRCNIEENLSKGLFINSDKTFIENVKMFRDRKGIDEYYKSTKYFIDKIDKNRAVMSEDDIRDAALQLKDLDKSICLNDNLRFLYVHLKGDPRIERDKSSIEKDIITSDSGRGSLFRIFYEYFFDKYKENYLEEDTIKKLNGLSLTNYLNTLLRFVDKKLINIKNFQSALLPITESPDLSIVDKELLLLLLAKTYKKIPDSFLAILQDDPGIIYRAVISPIDKSLFEEFFLFIKDRVFKEEKNFKDFWKKLCKVIFTNKVPIDILRNFSKYFFSRAAIWIQRYGENSGYFMDTPQEFNDYYNLICLLSTFCVISNDSLDYGTVSKIWTSLIKMMSEQNNVDLRPYWFQDLSHISMEDLSPKTVTVLLSSRIDGSFLQFISNKYHLLDHYTSILLLLLYRKSQGVKDFINYLENHKDLNTIIKRDLAPKSIFIRWMLKRSINLFPYDDCCLENIAENNITVLQSGDKFLLRLKGKWQAKFGYIHTEYWEEDKLRTGDVDFDGYSEIIIKKKHNYKRFSELIDECKNDTIKMLNLFVSVYKKTKEFGKKYKHIVSERFPNIFYDDSYVCTEEDFLYFPLIPHFALGKKFVLQVNNEKKVFTNNEENFCRLLLNRLHEQDIYIFEDTDHPYNYRTSVFEDKFYPGESVLGRKDYTGKMLYLERFVECFTNNFKNTAFNFEFVSITVLLRHIQKLGDNKNSGSTGLSLFLKAYHEKRTDEKLMLLFSVHEIEVSKDNFESFFGTIQSSVHSFYNQLKINVEDKDSILTLIKSDLDEIKKALEKEEKKINLSNFEYATISIKEEKNPITEVIDYYILINDEQIPFTDDYSFKTINMSYEFYEFQEISMGDLYFLDSNRFKFSYMKDSKIYIIVTSPELEKTFNSISKRKENFEYYIDKTPAHPDLRLFINNESVLDFIDNLPGYMDVRKAFDNHYGQKLSVSKIKSRIARWLGLYNNYSIRETNLYNYMKQQNYEIEFLHKVILGVLKAHSYIDLEDINEFKENLEKLKGEEYLLFSCKTLDDKNGLMRLIFKIGKEREIDIDDCIKKVINKKKSQRKLVVMSDVGIFGNQVSRAFGYYLKKFKYKKDLTLDANGEDIEKYKSKYFKFSSMQEAESFQKSFCDFSEIIFLSAFATDIYRQKASEKIIEFFNNRQVQPPEISVLSRRKLPDEEWCYGYVGFPDYYKELFEKLITDYELLQKIFDFEEGELELYEKSTAQEKIKKTNLVLRVQSVPKMHFKIFSLTPKYGVEKLFERKEKEFQN